MSRVRLPNRRPSINLDFTFRGGIPVQATVGLYPDGRVGELFLRSGLVGTDLSIAMTEVAIAVSMALQHGCSLETLRAAMPRTSRGEPEGAIGTLLDLLVKPELTMKNDGGT